MRTTLDRRAMHDAAAALAMAPVALYVYFFFEWLFLATGVTTLATQPMGTKLRALAEAPLPMLGGLLAFQLAASLLALAHRSLRAVAVVPSAAILGLLAMMLVDNFTYTVFGFGIIRTGPVARTLYAAGLLVLIVVAAVKLLAVASRLAQRPARSIALMAAASILLVWHVAARQFDGESARQEVAAGPTADRGGSLPNVLLLGSDGMDAQYLSAYGYERPTTPFLEELRRESLFFANAFSNVGTTRGAMVTLLTGRLPTRTKVVFPPSSVRREEALWHLPAILKARGYATLQLGLRHQADAEDANLLRAFDAANFRWESLFSSEVVADEGDRLRASVLERAESRVLHCFGFRQMVDAYEFTIGRGDDPDLRDAVRVAALVTFLERSPEPWLIHLHMLDTHCCSPKTDEVFFRTGRAADSRDNGFRNADARFRAIVDALRRNGQLDRTIIVISSDHPYLWETRGRVPLLIRFPGGRPNGTVRENAQLADVAPTILDYLDLPRPPWMDGRSLLSEPRDAERPIFGAANNDPERRLSGAWNPADSGPPNYGATVGSMILANRWYEIDFRSGRLTTGLVAGHTGPDTTRVDDAKAHELLRGHFAAAGFAIGDADPGRSGRRR